MDESKCKGEGCEVDEGKGFRWIIRGSVVRERRRSGGKRARVREPGFR